HRSEALLDPVGHLGRAGDGHRYLPWSGIARRPGESEQHQGLDGNDAENEPGDQPGSGRTCHDNLHQTKWSFVFLLHSIRPTGAIVKKERSFYSVVHATRVR